MKTTNPVVTFATFSFLAGLKPGGGNDGRGGGPGLRGCGGGDSACGGGRSAQLSGNATRGARAMSDRPIKRGGSDSARLRGDRGVVVYFTPEEYATLARAAAGSGATLKAYCRRAALQAAGLGDPRPATDPRKGPRGKEARPGTG